MNFKMKFWIKASLITVGILTAAFIGLVVYAYFDLVEDHIRLGNASFQRLDMDSAFLEYSEALKLNRNEVRAYTGKAFVSYYKKDKNSAEKYLQLAEKINKNHPDIAAARAFSYLQENELDKARLEYSGLLSRKPRHDGALSGMAWVYLSQKNYSKAAEFIDRAIQVNPNNAAFHILKGQNASFSGNYDQAISEYRLALAKDPSLKALYLYIIEILEKTGRQLEANQMADEIIKRDPDGAIAQFLLGNRALIEKKYELSLQYLERSLELERTTYAYASRGMALSQLNRQEEALEDFAKAIQMNPENARAFAGRAYTYALLQNKINARKDIAIALEKTPRDFYVLFTDFQIHLTFNEHDEALESIDKLSEVTPKQSVVPYLKWVTYAKVGDSDQAKEYWEKWKALELSGQ